MRSFAVWYNAGKERKNNKATIHINLWDKKSYDDKRYCFDIGVLVENLEGIDFINIYVPFDINKEAIKDLGAIISNNGLVNAIFNENYKTTKGEPKRLTVNKTEDKEAFIIYSLEKDKQIILESCKRNNMSPGTIIKIDIRELKLDAILRYYFRIRVEVKSSLIHMINNEIKGVSLFSDHFTNTEIIDFRINDIRSCSEELREQYEKGRKFDILAIHYLILRNANDIMINYGEKISSRMLENNIWSDYIDGADDNLIAYHIKEKAKGTDSEKPKYVKDFSDLTRFRYKKGTNGILAIYTIVVIGFGAIGGIVGNFFYDLLTKK